MLQCVYLISDGKGHYKIGTSNEPYIRMKTLEIGNPHKLKVLFISDPISNAAKIEHMLHREYTSNNLKGEWFKFNEIQDVISNIKKLVSLLGNKSEKKQDREITWNELEKIFGYQKHIEKMIRPMQENGGLEGERQRNKDAYEFLQYLQFGLSGGVYESLIYLNLFGKPLKQLQEDYHVKPKESIREYLTA